MCAATKKNISLRMRIMFLFLEVPADATCTTQLLSVKMITRLSVHYTPHVTTATNTANSSSVLIWRSAKAVGRGAENHVDLHTAPMPKREASVARAKSREERGCTQNNWMPFH